MRNIRRGLFRITAVLALLLPTPLAMQCTFCGDQAIPRGAMLLGRSEEDLSCQSLFDGLTGIQYGTEACDRIQLAAFQAGCCSESFFPRDSCSVCPGGAPFLENVVIPRTMSTMEDSIDGSNNLQKELTCGDLADEASFLDFFNSPGDCSDTYLQRSAGWCQCPGREIECTICPDASQVPDPNKMEKVLFGWNCATFEYVMALLSQAECPLASQKFFEFDASAFCCPHVVRPPMVCSFCPEGQVLADQFREIDTDFGVLTCGDIQESLSLVPTQESCQFARNKFNVEQCCVPGNTKSSSSTIFMPRESMIVVVAAVASVFLAL